MKANSWVRHDADEARAFRPRNGGPTEGAIRSGRIALATAVCGVMTMVMAETAARDGPGGRDPGTLPDWSISGSDTLRFEHYEIGGDESSSLFPFEGPQPYNDLFLNFSRRVSPYERWSGNFAAVASDSRYRTTDSGLTIERFNMTWEKGDEQVPYRIEAGDYFGYFSFRTLQRSLKGAQFDLQPNRGLAGERHSILALSGFVSPVYRSMVPQDDYYNGVSWLVEHDDLGLIALNGVHNHQQADPDDSSPKRNQFVLSLAGERKALFLGQRLTLEGEIARLMGDVGTGSSTEKDRSDNGYFAQIKGSSDAPLTYSLRFEQYDEHYRPGGAAITPNRRTWDMRGGWRFGNGVLADVRLQSFMDNLGGGVPFDTHTVGLTVSGPILFGLIPGGSGRLDTFVQEQQSDDGATDTFTRSLTLDLNAPVTQKWLARFGGTLQDVRDFTTGNQTITRQLDVAGDRSLEVSGLRGTVSPGLLVRNVTGASDSLDVGPSLALNLGNETHSVSANYRSLWQKRDGSSDLFTHDIATNYTYRDGAHTFGAEVEFQNRSPDDSSSTNSLKLAVFWRIDFDRPAPRRRIETPAAPTPPPPEVGPFRLTNFRPGLPLASAQRELTRVKITGGVFLPGAKVFEVRVLDDIVQRQRLVIAFDRGPVEKSAIIVEFDDVGNVDTTQQTFERVREILVRRYGGPVRTSEEGSFSASLIADVNNDRFIRVVEWDTPSGVLRFGIPRRVDRKVRMEIQLARRFDPPRQTLWSLEQVR